MRVVTGVRVMIEQAGVRGLPLKRVGIYVQGNFFRGGGLESFRETAGLGFRDEVEEGAPDFNNGVGGEVVCLALGPCAVQSSGGKATRPKRGAGWGNLR